MICNCASEEDERETFRAVSPVNGRRFRLGEGQFSDSRSRIYRPLSTDLTIVIRVLFKGKSNNDNNNNNTNKSIARVRTMSVLQRRGCNIAVQESAEGARSPGAINERLS